MKCLFARRSAEPSYRFVSRIIMAVSALALMACGGGGEGDGGHTPSPGAGGSGGGGAAGGPSSGGSAGSSGAAGTSAGGSTGGSGGLGGSAGSAGGGAGSAGSAGTGGGGNALGSVTFVPYYEIGSAWETSSAARTMVDTVFGELSAALRTSGDWDATIEVYLTDDNPGYANTYFDATFAPVTVDGKTMQAVPAWREIVLGEADHNGPADDAGNGYDFAIAFNVVEQAENAGLLRHESMHGLGAVNGVSNPIITPTNELISPVLGEWVDASVYDLGLYDKNGAPLLGAYDSTTQQFQVSTFAIDATFTEWTDGEAGLFYRGIADDAGNLDMILDTYPNGDDARVSLNEPRDLMSAGAHPTWNHVDEPDRAFFRAMRYQVAE